MLNLRLHQARTALNDGRLDEAYDLVRRYSLGESRDGQRLIGKLVERLVERSAAHLAADRLGAADADQTRAAQLAGRREDVEALGRRIEAARRALHDERRRRAETLDRARRAMRAADFDAGFRALDGVTNSPTVVALAEEMHMRDDSTRRLIERAHGALDRGDLDEAMRCVLATGGCGDGREVNGDEHNAVARRVVREAIERIRADIAEGRLHRAGAMLANLQRLGRRSGAGGSDVSELVMCLDDCREAWRALAGHDYRHAALVLRRVAAVMPTATWVADALAALDRLAGGYESLAAGPLGLIRGETPPAAHRSTERPDRGATHPRPGARSADASRPAHPASRPAPTDRAHHVLRIDGVGGYLLVTDAAVTIGPISSPDRPRLGLIADPTLPIVSVERHDDDYLLHAAHGAEVNGRTSTRHVLRDGDRITISPATRLKFHRPNAASQTALLRVGGSRLPQGDVRDVVLLGRELIIGPSAAAHVRTTAVAEPLKLIRRGDDLTCAIEATTADGDTVVAGEPLPLDRALRIGSITMTLCRA